MRDELGLSPTSRLKNTGTILEKLDRYGGSWLKSLQDLAGMRIVGSFDRNGQDELVARLIELLGRGQREPKVIDRRAEPSQGYRAVHVVVFRDDVPVEIQVPHRASTRMGRVVREACRSRWTGRSVRRAASASDEARGLRAVGAAGERCARPAPQQPRRASLTVAEMIAFVEEAKQRGSPDTDLADLRQRVDHRLEDLRSIFDMLGPGDDPPRDTMDS